MKSIAGYTKSLIPDLPLTFLVHVLSAKFPGGFESIDANPSKMNVKRIYGAESIMKLFF